MSMAQWYSALLSSIKRFLGSIPAWDLLELRLKILTVCANLSFSLFFSTETRLFFTQYQILFCFLMVCGYVCLSLKVLNLQLAWCPRNSCIHVLLLCNTQSAFWVWCYSNDFMAKKVLCEHNTGGRKLNNQHFLTPSLLFFLRWHRFLNQAGRDSLVRAAESDPPTFLSHPNPSYPHTDPVTSVRKPPCFNLGLVWTTHFKQICLLYNSIDILDNIGGLR